MDGLSTEISTKLHINSENNISNTKNMQQRSTQSSYIEEEEDEDEDGEDFSEEDLLAQMGYASSEPKRVYVNDSRGKYHQYEEEEEEEEEEDLPEESFLAHMGHLKDEPPKHEPITSPTFALNLVSALKGSPSEEGKPPKECRVSWAPDVYDPLPTSEDHFMESKTERHKSEHKVKGAAGKNKKKIGGKVVGASEGLVGGGGKPNKGGGSRGVVAGGGKAEGKGKNKKKVDQKQVKKHGGGASKYSSALDDY